MKNQAQRARRTAQAPGNAAQTTRNASAQSAGPEEPNEVSPTEGGGSELAQDLLLGAVAIAKELNWRGPKGQWNVRRVYHVKSKGTMPIHHVRGLGICARRSSLRIFFSALDDQLKASRADNATK
jgi:hypothetical protein